MSLGEEMIHQFFFVADVVASEAGDGVGVKFSGSVGLDCIFPSWLIFLCAKATFLLSYQSCQIDVYVTCTMILMI